MNSNPASIGLVSDSTFFSLESYCLVSLFAMQCPKCGEAMSYLKFSWYCILDDVCLDKFGNPLNRFDPNYMANTHVLSSIT